MGGSPAVPTAPAFASVFAEWSIPDNGYASNGQLKEMNVILSRDGGEQGRDFSMEYDELGRTISSSIETETGTQLVFLCEIATQRGIGRGAASLGAGRVPRGSRGAGTSEYLCRMERPGERLRE